MKCKKFRAVLPAGFLKELGNLLTSEGRGFESSSFLQPRDQELSTGLTVSDPAVKVEIETFSLFCSHIVHNCDRLKLGKSSVKLVRVAADV